MRKGTKLILLRLIFDFGYLVFVLTSYLRIFRFRRHYNNSYFSSFRQNIATSNQTFTYAFLKCIFQITKAVTIMTNNYNFIYVDTPFTIVGKIKYEKKSKYNVRDSLHPHMCFWLVKGYFRSDRTKMCNFRSYIYNLLTFRLYYYTHLDHGINKTRFSWTLDNELQQR